MALYNPKGMDQYPTPNFSVQVKVHWDKKNFYLSRRMLVNRQIVNCSDKFHNDLCHSHGFTVTDRRCATMKW